MANLISIIIPVYNVDYFLPKCIDSILAQSYDDLEVLLINDGSTDKSPQICEKYAEQNEKVRVFHKENGGVSSARNLGLKVAKGNYIGFIDADDWIEPNMYEKMLSHLLETNSQMCTCAKYIRNGNILSTSNITAKYIERVDSIKAILDYNFPSSLSTSLYKKELLQDMYLNEAIHHSEDFEFQFRVLNRVERVAICKTPFYNYRNRDGSANNSGFNPKVLTCLDILPIVKTHIEKEDSIDNKYICATISRMTLVVSAIMTRANYNDPRLEKILVKNARSAWFNTLLSTVPYKKKILITILSISYKLYSFLYSRIK